MAALNTPTDPFMDHLWREALTRVVEAQQAGAIADAEYAACYFLVWQAALWKGRFATRTRKHAVRPDPDAWLHWLHLPTQERRDAIITFFADNQFYGVRKSASDALLAWLRGRNALKLFVSVPSPHQVLALQSQGQRSVTVLHEYPRLTQPVLEKNNAFQFMLHDLEHAHQFFHDSGSHLQQVALACLWQRALADGLFANFLADKIFEERFHYLISDMNTHPLHALSYLYANIVEVFRRAESEGTTGRLSEHANLEIDQWVERLAESADFDPHTTQLMQKLSRSKLTEAEAEILLRALSSIK